MFPRYRMQRLDNKLNCLIFTGMLLYESIKLAKCVLQIRHWLVLGCLMRHPIDSAKDEMFLSELFPEAEAAFFADRSVDQSRR
jgi:hypothetical protein